MHHQMQLHRHQWHALQKQSARKITHIERSATHKLPTIPDFHIIIYNGKPLETHDVLKEKPLANKRCCKPKH